jgi:hypothetical protein
MAPYNHCFCLVGRYPAMWSSNKTARINGFYNFVSKVATQELQLLPSDPELESLYHAHLRKMTMCQFSSLCISAAIDTKQLVQNETK